MLHSTLPRAFLAPGLKYLGGFYGEDVHPYSATSYIPIEEHYSRIAEHHHVFPTWQSSRPATPCPLDLSLKPSPTADSMKTDEIRDETIEVDDDEDPRRREEAGRQLENQGNLQESDERLLSNDDVEVELDIPCSSDQSHHEYEQLILQKDQTHGLIDEAQEKLRALQESGQIRYLNNDTHHPSAQKYHPSSQKLLMTSPGHLQTIQSYHQQLLLTPQHHLQGINAPMTPPSTPSPPQCPRKRSREEDVASPTTPKQTTTAGKSVPLRPKKKHARRLKFDEDTSSPVSGTVILGPDEAVVTGDIDPAFNVVEVTEEARAELAKIENRLGPYQCRLCLHLHDDAFQLAQHRCSRIAHVEYRCPECDKRFSCPANLASHRRWHKPRLPPGENGNATTCPEVTCTRCDAKFTRQAALRKHMASQHPEANNNNINNSLISNGGDLLSNASIQLGAAPLVAELP